MEISVADCRTAGLKFEADEAVAIAQQLITSLRHPRDAAEVRAPYGPPAAENVFLNEDGSVVCRSCSMTPAVSEVGVFLDALLPAGSPHVPGGLRYAIARALLDVDVQPFDSLDAFSQDLRRHERGDRADLVRRVVARAGRQREIAPLPLVDRRRPRTSATALRRELREADVRLYRQSAAAREEPAVIDLVAAAPPPVRDRTLTATAACVAAGLSLIAAGELMHVRRPGDLVPSPSPAVHRVVVDDPHTAPSAGGVPERGVIAVRDVSLKPAPTRNPDSGRLVLKRTPRATVTPERRQPEARRSRRGVLDRLRLGWLRNAFTTHSDL